MEGYVSNFLYGTDIRKVSNVPLDPGRTFDKIEFVDKKLGFIMNIQIPESLEAMKLIPLKNNSKIPSVKWNSDEKFDLDGQKSITGYGIDTGRSNLVVIDCDNKNDIDGVVNFLALAREKDGMPTTFTVETPNNGLHFYFKAPESLTVKNSVSKVFGAGVDVRATGGYVVGPGSKIKLDDGTIGEYICEDEDENIQELPQWIFQLLAANENSKQKKSTTITQSSNDSPMTEKEELERENALNWAIDKINMAQPGERNNTLNHISYFMGSKRIEFYKAQKLIDLAIKNGLPENEAKTTFERAYNKGLEQEIQTFDAIVKEYNTRTGTSFKDDPMDTEFYGHVSLAYNFWLKNKDKVLFWNSDNQWYGYNKDEGTWEIHKEEEIKLLIKEFFEQLISKIRQDNSRIPVSVYRAQEKLWLKHTIESVASVARGDFLNTDKSLFNSNPMLINVKNGVFDITEQKLYPHSKEYYITKYIPIELDLESTDTYCDKVIESIHPEESKYLQLIAGQALTGYQPKTQAVFFLHGTGSNGKSTFIDLMLRTSGNYGKLQPPNIFLPDNGKEVYAMSDFEGLRAAIIEELPDSKHLNSSALKRLVGTQKINARPIYGKNREFENQSTIFVSCNRLPVVNETDEGTWRRLSVISFPYSYKKKQSDIVAEFDRLGSPRVLYAAQSRSNTAKAFLAWRVKGAIEWHLNEKAEYKTPRNIEKSLEEWNESNDLILAWFNENIRQESNSFITMMDILDSFNIWLISRGHSKVSMRYFSENFKNHIIFRKNKITHKQKAVIRKDLTHSPLVDENGEIKNTLGQRPSIFENISFK